MRWLGGKRKEREGNDENKRDRDIRKARNGRRKESKSGMKGGDYEEKEWGWRKEREEEGRKIKGRE